MGSQLELPGVAIGSADLSEVGVREIGIRIGVVRGVGHVEGIGLDGDLHLFVNRLRLGERYVRVVEARTMHLPRSGGAQLQWSGRCEATCIEPLRHGTEGPYRGTGHIGAVGYAAAQVVECGVER